MTARAQAAQAQAAAANEAYEVDDALVSCDGGGGALGHPKVFLNISAAGQVDCPYCGRTYRLAPGAKPNSSAH